MAEVTLVTAFAWGAIAVLALLFTFFGGYYVALKDRQREDSG